MTSFIKRFVLFCLISFLLGLFFTPKTDAASLSSASDTLTTSRPSAAAPLVSNQAASAGQVTVVDLPTTPYNSALWLASDSAVLLNDTGQSLNTINVSSMSASNTPSTNQRIVFFTNTAANTHHAGTTIYTSITATHTITFTASTSIPANGKIVLTFPGSGSNIASPSATGFSFNGEATTPTDVKCVDVTANNGTDCTTSGSGGSYASNQSNTFTITLGSTFAITGGHTISISIGCSAINNAGICTTFAPRLVNPVKTTTAVGSADQWKITIQTQDNNSINLDNTKVIAGTIESVQVQGIVEPYMTMTITGVADAGSSCSDTMNTGITPTATFVNMGSLGSATVSKAAQTIQIDTNASFGYSLTATSSGRFLNPATGVWITDANTGNGLTGNSSTNGTTPSPVALAAATAGFGIHPCIGTGSTTTPTIPAGWGTGGAGSNKYANPWNSGTNGYYALLANTTGPAAVSKTDVEYGAAVTATTPAGTYITAFTYVATPSF